MRSSWLTAALCLGLFACAPAHRNTIKDTDTPAPAPPEDGKAGSGGPAGSGTGKDGGAPVDAAVGAAKIDAAAADVSAAATVDAVPPDANRADAVAGADVSPVGDGADPQGKFFAYVSGVGTGVRVYDFDAHTGALTFKATSPTGGKPDFLAWDPGRHYMYALIGFPNSRIAAFAISPTDGLLTKINDAGIGVAYGPTHLAVHKSGKWLFLAHYSSGHVTVHPLMANGAVGDPVDTQHPATETCHSNWPDPTGKFLLVPCVKPNFVAQFILDDKTGKLTPNTPPTAGPGMPGIGPRHLSFHPNGKFAYVINESSGTMTGYNFDAATGRLTAIETVSTVPPGVSEHACAHVVVHASGKFVYGSNREHGSIVIYSVNQSTGRLTVVDDERGGTAADEKITSPRNFSIDPTGKYLLVANQTGTDTNTVLVFEIDATTGRLTLKKKALAPGSPDFVGVIAAP